MDLDAPEALSGFGHSGGGPAQGHPGVLPAFDSPADLPDDAVHRPDDVGADRGAPQVARQIMPDRGRKFIAPLEDGSGHIRRTLLEAPCKIADRAVGPVGVVRFPSPLRARPPAA